MSEEKAVPSSEKFGILGDQLFEPPREKNFRAHLEFHLRFGTRPNGRPGHPGEHAWRKEDFAEALAEAREQIEKRRSDKFYGAALKGLSGWLRGKRCNENPWGSAIERALFANNQLFHRWKLLLREARRARPQEQIAADDINPHETDEGLRKHDVTHAKLDTILSAMGPHQLEQAKRHGVTEAALRAIVIRLDAQKHNAPIEDILRNIESFIDATIREKTERAAPSIEMPDVVALRTAARDLLDAGQLDDVSSPFDVALQKRRKARADRTVEELKGDVRLLEEAAEYDRLALNVDGAVRRYVEAAVILSAQGQISEQDYLRGKATLEIVSYKNDIATLRVSTSLRDELLRRTRRSTSPLEWAAAQDELGTALAELAERESGTERLELAVAAYREALKEYTRERAPLAWAAVQSNLGIVLGALGDRESNVERIEQAVAAYSEALKEFTRERAPLDWAATQNNLGITYAALGRHENSAEWLEQAVAAYREALEERTRERVPLGWAATQNNLGVAYVALGKYEQAIAAFREALKEYTRERAPRGWARTQHNLGDALAALGELESGIERLEQAAAAYREALEERTRERDPRGRAGTQNDLGTVLAALGQRESGVERLEQAIAAFRNALEERTRERAPLDWAMALGNEGSALMQLAERRGDLAMAETALGKINMAVQTMHDCSDARNATFYEQQLPQAQATVARLRGQ